MVKKTVGQNKTWLKPKEGDIHNNSMKIDLEKIKMYKDGFM